MFNNAGGNFQLPALEISEGGFDAIVRMNLKSMFLGSQAAARMMIEEGLGGNIVSTASVAGLRSSSIGVAIYSVAKAGVMGMTRALRTSGAHSIRVNAVAPGAVDTAGRLKNMQGDPAERASAGSPLGGLAAPGDIAGAAVFLASDLAGHITGQALAADGGASIS